MYNARKSMEFLFVSRVRIKLLHHFLSAPNEPTHLRAAVREVREEINAVRRELLRMEEIRLLSIEVRGNRKYYSLVADGPFLDELRGIVFKTFGLGGDIIKTAGKLGDIKFALLTDNFYLNKEASKNKVDLVLIGDVNLPELQTLVDDYERKSKRELNYMVFGLHDFELRKKRRDQFVLELLMQPKLFLIGSATDLVNQ